MDCIYCGVKTKVSNSRKQKRTSQVWRRRTCPDCKAIFSTLEGVDLEKSLAVGKNGKIEPFSRDKLLLSVFSACGHRKDALESSVALTSTIIGKATSRHAGPTLERDEVVKIATETLKRFDRPAYVQYKAYHPL